jgi:transposase
VDLRERVVRAVAAGASRRAAAAKFEVSISCVVKLMQRWHQGGTIQPDRVGGWKRSTLAAHGERLRALLAAEPDLTIAELRHRLANQGIATSRSGVGRFLAAAGLTRKKDPARRRAGPAGRRRRPPRLARAAARVEPGAAGVHRRDLGHDQHGQATRPGAAWHAAGRCRAAWSSGPMRSSARPTPKTSSWARSSVSRRPIDRAFQVRRVGRTFALEGGTCATLRDADGRHIPSVWAHPTDRACAEESASNTATTSVQSWSSTALCSATVRNACSGVAAESQREPLCGPLQLRCQPRSRAVAFRPLRRGQCNAGVGPGRCSNATLYLYREQPFLPVAPLKGRAPPHE